MHTGVSSLNRAKLARRLAAAAARGCVPLLLTLAVSAHAADRTPTFWSLALGKAGASCTAVTRRHDTLDKFFEEKHRTRCAAADKGDHLLFTCGEHVEAVLFAREICKDWEQIPLTKAERKLATSFRACMERSKASFDRDGGVLYCDCAVRATKPKMSGEQLEKVSASCVRGLEVKGPPPRLGESREGPVETALRTACNTGVEVARVVLPARPNADDLQAQAYARCPGQLAQMKQPGGYPKGKDLVGIACGLGLDAMFAGYGLGSEVQGTPPSDRALGALEKCIADITARGITSDHLREIASLAVPEETPVIVPAAFGTCFAVSPDGLLVTARHLVAGKNEVSVRFGGGAWKPAKVEKASSTNDVAVLRVDAKPEAFLSIAPARAASLGLNVFTVGFPAPEILGEDMKFTEGTISALSGLEGERSLFQMSVPIQAGNSGGPLVTHAGEVIGIINSTAGPAYFAEMTGSPPQNVNYALKSDFALSLLPALKPQEAAKDRQAAIQRAVKAVCAVRTTR